MVSIIDHSNYRTFIRKKFLEMPKKGYGQANKLALFLEVHTTLVSQVLKGSKTFTLEQGALTCDFLALTDLETEYFLLLVQLDRAGNESLRKFFKKQLQGLKEKTSELVNRLQSKKKLSEEKRAVFYSDWTYSAIRQLTAIKGFQSIDLLASYLDLPKKRTREIIDFLLAVGLCLEENR